MGYTTKFDGIIKTDPALAPITRSNIRGWADRRDNHKPFDGVCDWKAADDNSGIVHNGMEKSYDQEKWLQALIDDVLKPTGYICNGIIECQGEDVTDRWRIYVRDNEVSTSDSAGWREDGPSYADQVNAPLSDATVEALAKELASDDPAKYRFARKSPHMKWEDYKRERAKRDNSVTEVHVTGPSGAESTVYKSGPYRPDDPKLAELRAKLHPEPEPAQPLSSVGDALRDLGNAIAFKATQGVDAVADFVTNVEGVLELCAEQGDTKPLDALFKSLRAEHDAEAERAEQAAVVDDDIPADIVTAYIDSMTDDDMEPDPKVLDALLNDIDVDAVESGGILFVNEEARDEFNAWVKNDRETAEAEHAAAWQKIHAEQAAEERVRDNLKAVHDKLLEEKSAQESREMYEEAAQASQELRDAGVYKEVVCSGIEDQLWDGVGDPGQWDDTVLNECWLIWSNKYNLWWMPNNSGYTEYTVSAGRYTFDQAVAIVKKSCRGWNQAQSNTPPTTMVPDPDRD